MSVSFFDGVQIDAYCWRSIIGTWTLHASLHFSAKQSKLNLRLLTGFAQSDAPSTQSSQHFDTSPPLLYLLYWLIFFDGYPFNFRVHESKFSNSLGLIIRDSVSVQFAENPNPFV